MFDQAFKDAFERDGYTIARGLFPPDEVAALTDHYMFLRRNGTYKGDSAGVAAPNGDAAADPLKQFPRMIHMHRWDDLSLRWLLDPRFREGLATLLGADPYAVQTMIYFKPPGARGQALHQDQFYLQVQPGTCMAAWLALDDCDEANGCLQVAPGSHTLPELCTEEADTAQSFTDVTVPLPEQVRTAPVLMKAGDVLFFNGQLIHGSFPNRTTDRFRRSLIGHYIMGSAEKVSKYYHPVLRMDGSVVELGNSERGGPCGVWVEKDGRPVVEMAVGE